jgi:hypothetical protein
MTTSSQPGVSGEAALEAARVLFNAEGLVFPPVPGRFVPGLRALSEEVFGTRAAGAGLYDLEPYAAELTAGPVDDYVAFGFHGRGFNSWAVHLYWVDGPLALLAQVGWGGAYTDAEAARRRVEGTFGLAGQVKKLLDEAAAAGRVPAGWRMLVVASDFAPPRFGWVTGTGAPRVNDNPMPLLSAISAAEDLAAGRTSLA